MYGKRVGWIFGHCETVLRTVSWLAKLRGLYPFKLEMKLKVYKTLIVSFKFISVRGSFNKSEWTDISQTECYKYNQNYERKKC